MRASSAPVAAGGQAPLHLVYIAGAYKSGATPLGTALGTVPGVFYAGELYRFPDPIFEPGDPTRNCSCGAPVDRCAFWTSVRARAGPTPTWLRLLRAGQLRFERWRNLPITLWKAWRNDPELRQHVDRMVTFIRWVAEQGNSTVVVESSYNPLRGWLYGRARPRELRVHHLHLVRDGRAFLATERSATDAPEVRWRWLRKGPVIVGRWVAAHLLTLGLLRRRSTYLRVRYEDLLRRPREGFAHLEAFLRIPLADLGRRAEAREPFLMRHVAAGNRVRLSGRIVLDPEFARPPRLDRARTTEFWALGGWLALWLGYRPALGRRVRSGAG